MSTLADTALVPRQREVLHRLGPVAEELRFHLAGGTAVAIRLVHRRSEDFDWFAEAPSLPVETLAPELARRGLAVEVEQTSAGTLHGRLDGVRVTFLLYRYPTLEPLQAWDSYGCRVASLRDLAVMKLSAISQRGSRKDFLDLHALLEAGLTLPAMLDDYRRRFEVRDILPVLYGLAYFDDAEREPEPLLLKPRPWAAVKDDIRRLARGLAP